MYSCVCLPIQDLFEILCIVIIRQHPIITRKNPSSSAGFVLTSSAGRRATNKALQLLLSSNACPHALLLGQIAEAFVHSHATANVTTGSVFSFHRY